MDGWFKWLQCEWSTALKWPSCTEVDGHHTQHAVLRRSRLLKRRIVTFVALQCSKSQMKRDRTLQTEVTLQKIRYTSNLGPCMKEVKVGFEKKIGFVLIRLQIRGAHGQKVAFGPLLIAVWMQKNEDEDVPHLCTGNIHGFLETSRECVVKHTTKTQMQRRCLGWWGVNTPSVFTFTWLIPFSVTLDSEWQILQYSDKRVKLNPSHTLKQKKALQKRTLPPTCVDTRTWTKPVMFHQSLQRPLKRRQTPNHASSFRPRPLKWRAFPSLMVTITYPPAQLHLTNCWDANRDAQDKRYTLY